jgi:hypothetical protein
MEPEDEETNLEFERINNNSSSSRTFSSVNNKSQIYINPDPNRQHLSNVQNQPKGWLSKPLHDNQKNMAFDRQIESFGNEWRLLSPTKNLSIHSRDIKMLFNSRHVRFKKEPIIEEVCIGITD